MSPGAGIVRGVSSMTTIRTTRPETPSQLPDAGFWAEAGGGVGVTADGWMRIAVLGKLKLPAVSSITLIWQVYWPGFRPLRGTLNWKAMALRSGSLSWVAWTSGVSKALVLPLRNSMLVSTLVFGF